MSAALARIDAALIAHRRRVFDADERIAACHERAIRRIKVIARRLWELRQDTVHAARLQEYYL